VSAGEGPFDPSARWFQHAVFYEVLIRGFYDANNDGSGDLKGLRDKLESNTQYFRARMKEAGFDIKPGEHPIVPIMLYDAVVAQEFAARLLDEGIYVIGFFFPVVPKGLARIRVQLSAAHSREQLDHAITAFIKVRDRLKK